MMNPMGHPFPGDRTRLTRVAMGSLSIGLWAGLPPQVFAGPITLVLPVENQALWNEAIAQSDVDVEIGARGAGESIIVACGGGGCQLALQDRDENSRGSVFVADGAGVEASVT